MILAALALAATAPSFDCAKASTAVEKMICADSELAAADRAVARLHVGVPASAKRVLWQSQGDWLTERNRCQNRACVLAAYEGRLFDLFSTSRTPTEDYKSDSINGSLSILNVRNGWFAFEAQGLWIGRNPGQVNTDIITGIFHLRSGKAERAPSDDDCGWRIERLKGDRWRLTELLPDNRAPIGCGGLNATATGVYSR